MSKQTTAISKEVYAKVSQRDMGCVLCGTPRDLQCHHIVPRSRQGMGIEQNLVMLCKQHHDHVHQDMKYWQVVLLEINEKHYGSLRVKDMKMKNKWHMLGGLNDN